MAQTAIDLSRLPPPVVVEALDFEIILAGIKADMIARGGLVGLNLAPVLSLETEPLNILAQASAYRELTLRNQFNLRAQANMLAFAVGGDLDNLAVNLDAQRDPGESDEAFRARAIQAPDGWAVAGPLAAYDYIARRAHPEVADVEVISPTPGQVLVTVLSTAAAGTPSAAVLAAVNAALSAEDVRPFTDQVVVASATVVFYDVTAQISVAPGPDRATVQAAAQVGVLRYAGAQRRIRRPIRLPILAAAMVVAGVNDVTIAAPAADLPPIPGVAYVVGAVAIDAVTA